jgi:sugar lactone lactonase YvrE
MRIDMISDGLGAPNDMAFGPDGRLWITDTRAEFDISAPGDGVALTAADRVDVVDAAGRCIGTMALPAGSLPTNVCIGGERADELFVTAAHSQALLRIRFDGDGPCPGR